MESQQQMLLCLAWHSTVRRLDQLASNAPQDDGFENTSSAASPLTVRERKRKSKQARKYRQAIEEKVLHYWKRAPHVGSSDGATRKACSLVAGGEQLPLSDYWFPFPPQKGNTTGFSQGEQTVSAEQIEPTSKKRKRVTFNTEKNSVVIIHKHPAVAASVIPPALFVREARAALRLRLPDSESDELTEEQSAELLTTRAVELARDIQNYRRKPLSGLHLERLYSLCRDQASTSIFIVTSFIDYGDVDTVVDVLLDPYY